jgi:hypothetical protein
VAYFTNIVFLKEISEVDRALHERVHSLLEGQLDVAAHGQGAAFLRAAVRRLHDSRAAARDDRESRIRQEARRLYRLLVHGLTGHGACGSEEGDRVLDIRERVESFDELPHDAEHAPRVGTRKRRPPFHRRHRLRRQKELFVLSNRLLNRAARALRHDRPVIKEGRGFACRVKTSLAPVQPAC